MNYSMTTPCDQCPYLLGSGFTWGSLKEHASGEFACHKTCKMGRDGSTYVPAKKSLHCAGALLFHMHQGTSTQMMRINQRLGFFDPSKLDMAAPVVKTAREARYGTKGRS